MRDRMLRVLMAMLISGCGGGKNSNNGDANLDVNAPDADLDDGGDGGAFEPQAVEMRSANWDCDYSDQGVDYYESSSSVWLAAGFSIEEEMLVERIEFKGWYQVASTQACVSDLPHEMRLLVSDKSTLDSSAVEERSASIAPVDPPLSDEIVYTKEVVLDEPLRVHPGQYVYWAVHLRRDPDNTSRFICIRVCTGPESVDELNFRTFTHNPFDWESYAYYPIVRLFGTTVAEEQ